MNSQLSQSRYASVIVLIVGIWVALSPIWISITGAALASVIITGIIIALMGLVQLFWKYTLPSWIAGLAAIWLFISTFAIAGASAAVIWNQVVFSVVTFVLSIWDGAEMNQVQSYNQQHHAT